jgi:hypothetical protein
MRSSSAAGVVADTFAELNPGDVAQTALRQLNGQMAKVQQGLHRLEAAK